MKRTNIPVYIDLLFCLVIMPPIIMLVPVDKWIVHHTVFMLTLIVYLYGLYFIYRKVKLPMLFMQRKFGHILVAHVITYLYHMVANPLSIPTGTQQYRPDDA